MVTDCDESIEVLERTKQRFTKYRTPPEDSKGVAVDEDDFVWYLLDLFEEKHLDGDDGVTWLAEGGEVRTDG